MRTLMALLLLLLLLPLGGRAQRLGRWGVATGDYSGITPLAGERYAVVSDSERRVGFYVWNIRQDSVSGRILSVTDEGFRGVEWPERRDQEGIAYCPASATLFISGEADQRILEHRLDGLLTGAELSVPKQFGIHAIQPNRGFEALCYDSTRQCLWTVTESALKDDEPGHLRLLRFDVKGQLLGEAGYQLSEPQARSHGRDYYHGVAALCVADDGTLLVLEREARIARHYSGSRCWCRIFRYNPETGEKLLVYNLNSRFTLFNTRFANYEGMCFGRRLVDGRQTLLLVTDAQNGAGRALWHLKDRIKCIFL